MHAHGGMFQMQSIGCINNLPGWHNSHMCARLDCHIGLCAIHPQQVPVHWPCCGVVFSSPRGVHVNWVYVQEIRLYMYTLSQSLSDAEPVCL
jgi:hypothetical protein